MIAPPVIPDEHRLPELPIASVPRRTIAYLADILLLAIVLFSVQGLLKEFAFGGATMAWQHEGPKLYAFVVGTFSLPVWLYFTFFESGARGATLGKRLLRIRVSTPTGEGIGRGKAFLRTLVKLVPWELTHIAICLPTPIWDAGKDAVARPTLMVSTIMVGAWFGTVLLAPRAQGVHDLMLGTLVVDDE